MNQSQWAQLASVELPQAQQPVDQAAKGLLTHQAHRGTTDLTHLMQLIVVPILRGRHRAETS
jgi:hypothetical protein